jgi:uncharacterized membrane protein
MTSREGSVMDWPQFAVLWLHVLGGIFWFGGVLFANVVLFPAVQRLAPDAQRELMRNLTPRMYRIVEPVAVATMVLGFLRGTVFGSIRTFDALGTPYGLTWLVALLAAVVTYALGLRLARIGEGVFAMSPGDPAFEREMRSLQLQAGASMLGFFVVFTGMILMRFGL